MITNLLPTSQGSYNNWTLGAGASKPSALPTNDGDTSYITVASALRDSYIHGGLPAWVFGISAHTVTHVSKTSTGGPTNFPATSVFLRRSSADTDGAIHTVTDAYAAYNDSNLISATPTVAQVNATEIGVWLTSAGFGDGRVTKLIWGIVHAVAPRGFVCLIGQWLGPLVAVGLAEMRRLATEVWRKSDGQHLITPDEYALAWRDLREARNRKFYFRPASGLYVPV